MKDRKTYGYLTINQDGRVDWFAVKPRYLKRRGEWYEQENTNFLTGLWFEDEPKHPEKCIMKLKIRG